MSQEPNSSVLALSAYPLSSEYRVRLEAVLGTNPEYLTLTELRQKSLPAMLGGLIKKKAEKVVLPVEDTEQLAVLPLLTTLAALIRTRRVDVLEPDLSPKQVGRLAALKALASAATASIGGLLVAWLCRLELAWLNVTGRKEMTSGDGSVLYLKTNLGLGVKAGGSVGHIAGVVNGLVGAGIPVTFLSAEEPLMVSSAVAFRRIRLPRAFGLPRDVNQYRFHRLVVRKARQLADASGTRFIYQRLSLGNYAGVVLSRRLGIPLVIEYNGSEVWVSKHWGYPLAFPRLAANAEKACLRHAHLVVTVSDVLRDELAERGVDPDRIVTYPNCIDPEVFDPARFSPADLEALRDDYGIPRDALVVTFIGTFGRWHGTEVFAQAIALLMDRHEDWLRTHHVYFLLVGDGLMRPEVDSILAGERRAQRVVMPGLIPQAAAPIHLAASDILVSPHVPNPDGTPFFGSPTKLFEYMAMGKAIVASDLDQIGQIFAGSPRVSDLAGGQQLGDGCAALLAEPGDPAELADGIRLLGDHPRWRRRLGRQARQEALSRYTWTHHVDSILAGIKATEHNRSEL